MKRRRDGDAQLPPLCQNIDRVSRIVALGITINDRMTGTHHISGLIDSRTLYALRVLRDHGMPLTSLQDVFRATILSKLLYAAPAWSGSCSGADRRRLEAFFRRCRKLRYCDDSQPALSELFDTADDQLFLRANGNNEHVLQTYMPEYARPIFDHNLRPRRHSRQLITKTLSLIHI